MVRAATTAHCLRGLRLRAAATGLLRLWLPRLLRRLSLLRHRPLIFLGTELLRSRILWPRILSRRILWPRVRGPRIRRSRIRRRWIGRPRIRGWWIRRPRLLLGPQLLSRRRAPLGMFADVGAIASTLEAAADVSAAGNPTRRAAGRQS